MLFICYPACSTCKKARDFLAASQADFTERNIKTDRPTEAELIDWIKKSGLPLKKWFNTSGLLYKEQKLKDKLPTMNEAEQISLLASDGMLVKRPVLINGDRVLVGFKQADWQTAVLREDAT